MEDYTGPYPKLISIQEKCWLLLCRLLFKSFQSPLPYKVIGLQPTPLVLYSRSLSMNMMLRGIYDLFVSEST